ncbi:unnamed protein product, partial [Prorocentrum cordatum]
MSWLSPSAAARSAALLRQTSSRHGKPRRTDWASFFARGLFKAQGPQSCSRVRMRSWPPGRDVMLLRCEKSRRWVPEPAERITFSSMDEMIETMKEQAARAEPLVVEGAGIIGTERWADVEGHLGGLLGDRAVLVKRSPSQRFRYFDLKKNTGRYDFKQPLREEQMCLRDFLAESRFILEEGRAERMYLQETLSGHAEMAEEFASWRWELLIRVSSACGCP